MYVTDRNRRIDHRGNDDAGITGTGTWYLYHLKEA